MCLRGIYALSPLRVDRVLRRNGYIATERAREPYECPARVFRHSPVSADHSLTERSMLPLASIFASGLQATAST